MMRAAPGAVRRRTAAAGSGVALAVATRAAWAHAGEGAFLQLLPTSLYMIGGALAVALSFVVVALAPGARFRALFQASLPIAPLPARLPRWPGYVTLALLAALVAAGFIGSRDPLDNPLPVLVWSVFWVGLAVAHALAGNLWSWLSPWPALHALLTAPPGLRALRERPPLALPEALAHWPAVLSLLVFAWVELVYPAPEDPARLAWMVIAYAACTALGMLLFGAHAWLARAELFSAFFRMVSWVAPLQPGTGAGGRPRLLLMLPAARLGRMAMPAPGTAVFVLCALATVSFDGLSHTFRWIALAGANPLEYPGRTAMLPVDSAGLLGTAALFLAIYAAVVLAGRALARSAAPAGEELRAMALSIVPIAFGYHLAHYYPTLLINTQYALRAVSDPFARGWNLFGTAHMHVITSFLSNHDSVQAIWNTQVAVIVTAHVLAVCIAHLVAGARAGGTGTALRAQLPMTTLMVGYTVFGLWLLSTPAIP